MVISICRTYLQIYTIIVSKGLSDTRICALELALYSTDLHPTKDFFVGKDLC